MKARYETRRAPMGDMAWRARAACQYRDPGPWFSGVQVEIAKAREVCMGCPVRSACLCSQLEYEELIGQVDDGMFGGRTPRERKVLLRHRESIAPPRMGRPQVVEILNGEFPIYVDDDFYKPPSTEKKDDGFMSDRAKEALQPAVTGVSQTRCPSDPQATWESIDA